MRRPVSAWAACVGVLAAAAGCSGGGGGAAAEAPPDPAAEVARALQGSWDGPCAPGPPRSREQYTFSGRELRYEVWGFETADCAGGGLLLDRAIGTFAIGSRFTAAVAGAGFDVVAWQLDVTWAPSTVSRSLVAPGDARDPQRLVLLGPWDAEAVPSSVVPAPYRRAGQPPFDFGTTLLGQWARCETATQAGLREFTTGDDVFPEVTYWEGDVQFADACFGQWVGSSRQGGRYELGPSVVAGLDGTPVIGQVLRLRVVPLRDRWQTAFIAQAADRHALYLSEYSYGAEIVATVSASPWRRVEYP
jgi:hypothetical protein